MRIITVESTQIITIGNRFSFKIERIEIKATPPGRNKNVKLSRRKLLISLILLTFIIPLYRQAKRIIIPKTLPGIGK